MNFNASKNAIKKVKISADRLIDGKVGKLVIRLVPKLESKETEITLISA